MTKLWIPQGPLTNKKEERLLSAAILKAHYACNQAVQPLVSEFGPRVMVSQRWVMGLPAKQLWLVADRASWCAFYLLPPGWETVYAEVLRNTLERHKIANPWEPADRRVQVAT